LGAFFITMLITPTYHIDFDQTSPGRSQHTFFASGIEKSRMAWIWCLKDPFDVRWLPSLLLA
jgi:hypothetical protein